MITMLDAGVSALKKSVRSIVTLAFVAAFIYGFLIKLVSAEVFVGVAVLIIKYWFDDPETSKGGSNETPIAPTTP